MKDMKRNSLEIYRYKRHTWHAYTISIFFGVLIVMFLSGCAEAYTLTVSPSTINLDNVYPGETKIVSVNITPSEEIDDTIIYFNSSNPDVSISPDNFLFEGNLPFNSVNLSITFSNDIEAGDISFDITSSREVPDVQPPQSGGAGVGQSYYNPPVKPNNNSNNPANPVNYTNQTNNNSNNTNSSGQQVIPEYKNIKIAEYLGYILFGIALIGALATMIIIFRKRNKKSKMSNTKNNADVNIDTDERRLDKQ